MLSRLFPILKTCTFVTKHAAPVNSQLCRCPVTQVNLLLKYRKMSTVPDEILNEPARNLDYNQLLEKKKDGKTVLIDVREHYEINETGKLPDSIHIPLKEVERALRDLPPDEFYNMYKSQKPSTDAQLIFSCRSGRRSLQALKTALELGYKNAAHYKGGWLDWEENTKKNQN